MFKIVFVLYKLIFQWSIIVRSAVRKEKGLPILVELLRINHDPVVRAVSTAMRNLAIDPRNKDVLAKYGIKDLLHRLPYPGAPSNVRAEENTIGAILCAIHQLMNKSLMNGRHANKAGGFQKIIGIAKSRDHYSPRIVLTANQVLITLWNLPALRSSLKKEGREFTKEIGDEYGHVPPTPRPYDEVTMPREPQRGTPSTVGRNEPRPVRYDETSIPEPRYESGKKSEPQRFSKDGYEADDDARRRREPNNARDELEMEGVGGYREIDHRPGVERGGGVQGLPPGAPPAYPDGGGKPQEEPTYAQVDKSKKKTYKLQGGEGATSDSWV